MKLIQFTGSVNAHRIVALAAIAHPQGSRKFQANAQYLLSRCCNGRRVNRWS